jgi:hypothetical protein
MAAVFGRWKIMIHVAVKALVPIRISVMREFYTGNRPEKHSSGNGKIGNLKSTHGRFVLSARQSFLSKRFHF